MSDLQDAPKTATKAKAARKRSKPADTREAWLTRAMKLLAPLFREAKLAPPEKTVAAVGWPKRGKANTIGQCFAKTHTEDGTTYIWLSPVLGEDPARVLDVLLHEMVHAAVGCECGHKGPFAEAARALGLDGKLTATVASPKLRERLVEMATKLGPYPHSVMRGGAVEPKTWKAGKTKRLVLRSVNDEDYWVYMSRDMYVAHGAPVDPWGDELEPTRQPKEDNTGDGTVVIEAEKVRLLAPKNS